MSEIQTREKTADEIAAEKAAIEARYQAVAKKYGVVERPDGKFEVLTVCDSKEIVTALIERLERVGDFDRMFANSFRDGMADGIFQYKKMIAKNGLTHEKCTAIGNRLLSLIASQPRA